MPVSIDGFVAGPDGEADWIFKTQDEGATAWLLDTVRGAGVHIMATGRSRTMAAYWPYTPGLIAAAMNEIPKVVFSEKGLAGFRSPEVTTWSLRDAIDARARQGVDALGTLLPSAVTCTEASVAAGDLADEIARLKQVAGKDIAAHGGGTSPQACFNSGSLTIPSPRSPRNLGTWPTSFFCVLRTGRPLALELDGICRRRGRQRVSPM